MKSRVFFLKFIVSGLLILSSGLSAETIKPLVKEIVLYENDSIFRILYFYDEYANKVLETKYLMVDNIAVPTHQQEWIYENDYCVQQLRRKWESGSWKTNYIISTTYAEKIKMKEEYVSVNEHVQTIEKTISFDYNSGKLQSSKTYRGIPENTQPIEIKQFRYDEAGRVNSQQFSFNHADKSQIFVYTHTYNKFGQTDSLIVSENSPDGLMNKNLTVYQYDDELLITQIQKVWSENAGRWINTARSEFQYQGDSLLKAEIYAQYSGMFWTPLTKYEYIYDNRGFLSKKLMHQPIYKQWRRIYTIEYGGIEHNKPSLMESKFNFWGGVTGEYVKNYIPFYFNDEMNILKASKIEVKYITDLSDVNSLPAGEKILKVYPNPSDGIFYISTHDHVIDTWEVFSPSGKKLKTGLNTFRTGVIDLTGMPAGMYFIRAFTADNQILTQKISLK